MMRRILRGAASAVFWLLLAGFVLAITVGPFILLVLVGVGLGYLAHRILPGRRDGDAP